MSSGITWNYTVTTARETEAPVTYLVGTSWASGENRQFEVSLCSGLEAVCGAYMDLPGLGAHRRLWASGGTWGASSIMRDASHIQVDLAAKAAGIRCPIPAIHGFGNLGDRISQMTIRDYLAATCKEVWGQQAADHAGLNFDGLFLDRWPELALAADAWPKSQWGEFSKVTGLRVTRAGSQGQALPIETEEAAGALAAAWTWSGTIPGSPEAFEVCADLARLLTSGLMSTYGSALARSLAKKFLV